MAFGIVSGIACGWWERIHCLFKFACKCILGRFRMLVLWCITSIPLYTRDYSYHLNWSYREIVNKSVFCDDPSLDVYFNRNRIVLLLIYYIGIKYLIFDRCL